MVADQPLGVIGEQVPAAPAHVQGVVVPDPVPVPMAPLLGVDADPAPPAVPSAPPGPLAQDLRQRQLQLLWDRLARLQQAIQAKTRVDFDRAPAPGAGAT